MRKFIYKLNILPGYIPPKKDELLSSWVFRLALNHKIKPFSFTKFYFEESVFWTRDIDKFLYDDVITKLTELTPLSRHQILEHHLISYQDKLFTGELNPAHTMGLNNLGIYHRTRTINGLLACPSCLAKDSYYKKQWRLQTSLMCLECNCLLIDACPNCSKPIIFHRLDIGNKSELFEDELNYCWNCNFDLRKAFKILNGNALLKRYQKFINNTLVTGFCKHTQYSFLYFEILLKILTKFKTKSKLWNRIQEGFIIEFRLNRDNLDFGKLTTSLNFRLEILPLIFYLIDDIPNRFIPFCTRHNIRYSDISKDSKIIPYWFFKEFREF